MEYLTVENFVLKVSVRGENRKYSRRIQNKWVLAGCLHFLQCFNEKVFSDRRKKIFTWHDPKVNDNTSKLYFWSEK